MQAKTLSPIFALIALIVVVGLACSTSSTPTPTPTPLPPTNTPTPEPTETPTPTATPDYAATQAAHATEVAAARQEEIVAELKKLELPTEGGELIWLQEEDVKVEMVGGIGEWTDQRLAEGITASNFVLKIDMTWDTNSWPVCGIIFRASDEDFKYADFYTLLFLRLSGLPAWDIAYYKRGSYVTTITQQARFSDALKLESGDTNQIVLYAQDNNFTVYINGRRQGRYPDFSSILDSGSFGVTGSQDGGETTCTFSNGWIWAYK